MGFQKDLLDSAQEDGGYGRKVAHPMIKGISDLLIQLPRYSMVQVECKDLGPLKTGFQVKSGITQQQKDHIFNLNRAAGGMVAFYCFHIRMEGHHFAMFVDKYKETIADDDFGWCPYLTRDGLHSYVYLSQIWQQLGVPKIVT